MVGDKIKTLCEEITVVDYIDMIDHHVDLAGIH